MPTIKSEKSDEKAPEPVTGVAHAEGGGAWPPELLAKRFIDPHLK